MTDVALEAGIELIDAHSSDVVYRGQIVTLDVGRGRLHVVEIAEQEIAAVCGTATARVVAAGAWHQGSDRRVERCAACVEMFPPTTTG